jgi:hypothetical protein
MDRIVSPLVIQRTAAEWGTQNPFLARGDLGAESDTGREKIGVGLKWSDTPYKPVGPIFKLKLADQTLASSTTLTDDDTLFFMAEANSTYAVSMNLIVVGVSNSVQIYGKVVAPDASTLYGLWAYVFSDNWQGTETPAWTNGGIIGDDSNISDYSGACAVPQSFVVKTGATAGTVKFQFRQGGVSTTAVEVKAGSFLKAEKVA